MHIAGDPPVDSLQVSGWLMMLLTRKNLNNKKKKNISRWKSSVIYRKTQTRMSREFVAIRVDTGVCVLSRKSRELRNRMNTSLPAPACCSSSRLNNAVGFDAVVMRLWKEPVARFCMCKMETAGILHIQFSGFYSQVMSENSYTYKFDI